MTLSKEEQVEALATTKYPKWFSQEFINETPELVVKRLQRKAREYSEIDVDELHANGFCIAVKGGEDNA